MSGQPLIKPSDAQKYRSAYLNNLALEAKNNSKNLNANQVYKQTGAPAQPMDTRTTTEKLADIARLKVEVMNQLLAITDGQQANQIVQSLADNEVQYVAQNMPYLIKDINSKYAKGITAGIFLPMVRSMINQAVVYSGVQYGLKNIAGNGLTGNIGTFIASALTPIQYDLLLEILGNDRQAIRAVGMVRSAFQQLPQINQKISAFPLEYIAPIIDALGDSFQDVPTRAQVDDYFRQIRVGGQASAEAKRQLGQIFIDAANTMEQNKVIVNNIIEETYKILNESSRTTSRNTLESYEGDETMAPSSRKVGGSDSNSNTADLDLPDFDYGVSGEQESFVSEPPVAVATKLRQLPSSVAELQAMEIKALKELIEQLSLEQKMTIQSPYWNTRTMKPKTKVRKDDLIAMLVPFIIEPVEAEAGQEDADVAEAMMKGEKEMEGEGMRRKIRGRGLVKTTKKYPPKTDGKVRIEKQPNWTQIGDKLIHTSKLQNNILSMRCLSGRNVDGVPTQHISHKLGAVLRKIVGGQLPTYDDVDILSEEEKDKLARIGSISKINSKINIPKKTKEQQEMLEFDILRGQVLAGNDNKGLLKRFKLMLIKFGDEGKLPQREVRDVLMTLASQGL